MSCHPVSWTTSSSLSTPSYRLAYLSAFILITLFLLLGVLAFVSEKRKRGRLAKRSTALVVTLALGCELSALVVMLREFVGRERFPCASVLSMHYMFIPLLTGPLIAKVFVHAYRLRMSRMKAGLSFAAVRREQDRVEKQRDVGGEIANQFKLFVELKQVGGSVDAVKLDDEAFEVVSPHTDLPFDLLDVVDDDEQKARTTATTTITRDSRTSGVKSSMDSPTMLMTKHDLYLMPRKKATDAGSYGSWTTPHGAESEPVIHVHELIKHESTVFGLFLVVLFSIPSMVVIIIRVTTDSVYDLRRQCTGCDMEPLDYYIMCGIFAGLFLIFAVATVKMWSSPDPLGILFESKLSLAMILIWGIPTVVLYLVDPGNLEKTYQFTWLTFETLTAFSIVMIQTFGQIILTKMANRRVPKNVNLFRLLENVSLRDMFDDHLATEFSIENLRFWDRAVHWKSLYHTMPGGGRDLRGRELYRIFIAPEATMALNLSAKNFTKLHEVFGSSAAAAAAATATHNNSSSTSVMAVDPEENRATATKPASFVLNLDIDIFDNALKECFKLMNDGLARFVTSSKYKRFISTAPPDYESDFLRNKELGLDLNATVDQYLNQVETMGTNNVIVTSPLIGSPSSSPDRKLSTLLKSVVRRTSKEHLPGSTDVRRTSREQPTTGQMLMRSPSVPEMSAFQDDDESSHRPISLRVSVVQSKESAAFMADRRRSSIVDTTGASSPSMKSQQQGGQPPPNAKISFGSASPVIVVRKEKKNSEVN